MSKLKRQSLLFTVALLLLAACSKDASHIPPLHQIPSAAVRSVIENSRYESRRKKVKAAIHANVDTLLSEADRGGGTTFSEVCTLAKVNTAKCKELAGQVSQDDYLYAEPTLEERIENLTVAFMVYGD